MAPISGYHVTDIGTSNLVPDIDPDIGYEIHDIGDLLTRYRVGYPISVLISGQALHVPISRQKENTTSGHMTRYRVVE